MCVKSVCGDIVVGLWVWECVSLCVDVWFVYDSSAFRIHWNTQNCFTRI